MQINPKEFTVEVACKRVYGSFRRWIPIAETMDRPRPERRKTLIISGIIDDGLLLQVLADEEGHQERQNRERDGDIEQNDGVQLHAHQYRQGDDMGRGPVRG